MTVKLPVNGSPEPLIFRETPSRRLTILATTEDGQPVVGQRFSVRTSGYSTAASRPDESEPGTYHVWIPEDAKQCRFSTAFTPGLVACWRLNKDGPSACGNYVSFGNAAGRPDLLFVNFRKSAHLRVDVKAGVHSVPLNDTRISVAYAQSDQDSCLRPFERSIPVRRRLDETVHYIDHVAPDEDVVIDASINGALLQRKTIRLAAGETRYLTIDLAAADNAPIVEAPVLAQKPELVNKASPTLTVKYDMPGSDEEARIFVERTGGAEGEIGSHGNGAMKWTPLKNGSSFELKKLMPGEYQVARIREAEIVTEKDPPDAKRAQKITTAAFLDRHRFTLEAGQQMTIDLSRKSGQRFSGTIARADDVKPARMILDVCSANAEGVDNLHSLDTTIFDAQQCNDGDFNTDQLEPGEYSLIAVGYDAWPKEAFFRSGEPRAGYIGRIKLTVPRNGQAEKLQVPLYRIHFPAGS